MEHRAAVKNRWRSVDSAKALLRITVINRSSGVQRDENGKRQFVFCLFVRRGLTVLFGIYTPVMF